MDGQAEQAPESSGLADLVDYLDDTPEEESSTEETPEQGESTEEIDTDTQNDEETTEAVDEPTEDDGEPEVVEKITIKVKGDDGEETLEVTPEEVASSYMRQKDYTKKTQALAERENQAVQFIKQKHDEFRDQYLSQAEVARAAVAQMAGIKTESEMETLAVTDPAAWVAESQRQRQIGAYLNQLDQQINGEKQRAIQQQSQYASEQKQQAYQKAWEELSKDGLDKPKLKTIYENANKHYGFSDEELANVYDARMVRALRDAAAYRELQSQKQNVTKKVANAPRMPTRQTPQANERISDAMNAKFKSGRAKLSDLASIL
jgi:hypothetical protein